MVPIFLSLIGSSRRGSDRISPAYGGGADGGPVNPSHGITDLVSYVGVVPASHVREDVVIAHKKEIEWQAYEKLLPFKNMCAKRKGERCYLIVSCNGGVNQMRSAVTEDSIIDEYLFLLMNNCIH
ncbi:hypothetical protein L2E82_49812 [Cichorium intybus]|uniref:Uncharacterized protein n=1 Tax=Cichorium intybus TaxID=13427 RepID=A0ACB8Z1D9_CICIN|nr:hypothetical protein L2E82_49812 [Cichorium intybus]